jgi:PII-like signaling protein
MAANLEQTDIGMQRNYTKPRDKVPSAGSWLAGRRPLYRELILQAKAAGILNAIAHHTHFGYSNHGKGEDEGGEVLNPSLTMCLELVASRGLLEACCQTRQQILARKVIIYKHIERLQIVAPEPANAV